MTILFESSPRSVMTSLTKFQLEPISLCITHCQWSKGALLVTIKVYMKTSQCMQLLWTQRKAFSHWMLLLYYFTAKFMYETLRAHMEYCGTNCAKAKTRQIARHACLVDPKLHGKDCLGISRIKTRFTSIKTILTSWCCIDGSIRQAIACTHAQW